MEHSAHFVPTFRMARAIPFGLAVLTWVGAGGCSSPSKDPEPESREASRPASSLLLDLPPEVRKDLYRRLVIFSDQVGPIEQEIVQIEKIEDPSLRMKKLDEARDKLAAIADGITEVLDDKKYEKYNINPRYSHNFAAYWQRLNFYTARLNQLKKKRDQAFNEMKAAEAKAKEKAGG